MYLFFSFVMAKPLVYSAVQVTTFLNLGKGYTLNGSLMEQTDQFLNLNMILNVSFICFENQSFTP